MTDRFRNMTEMQLRWEYEIFAVVLELVADRPRLVNDVRAELRDRGFSCVPRQEEFCRDLRAYGFALASREYGAGVAIYVAAEPFQTVVDGKGRVRDVRPY